MRKNFASSPLKLALLPFFLFLTGSYPALAQNAQPSPTPKEEKQESRAKSPDGKNVTADQVAESVIYIYAGLAGRNGLNQIRRTAIERGKLNITNADGTTEQATYEKRVLRGDNLEKERVRFDQQFAATRYALIYNDNKILGVYNDSVFTPREDASKSFNNQLWHGLEALLRYKENGSTLELAGREKMMNVDYYILDVTDKEKRKTRFYVSAKSFRVMWLEYDQDSVKYKRRFYDYRYAQGTLVPYRTVLLANDKQVEETMVSTVTFGQKIDETVFQAS